MKANLEFLEKFFCQLVRFHQILRIGEQELGAPLFERTPEGLVETDVARAIAPLAERIDVLTRDLQDAATAASDAPKGPVRIAVGPVFADHFLIPRVPELRRRFPDVMLEIHAEVARVNMVRREADIAIRQLPEGNAPGEPSALALKVGKFGAAAYASPAYVERRGLPERPVRSLAGHEMISTGARSPGDSWNAQLEQPADYVLSVHPLAAAAAAAIAGIGIAVLPCVASDSDPRLVRLSDVVVSIDNWVVTNHDARNNPRVRGVKDALVEMIRDGANELGGDASTHRR